MNSVSNKNVFLAVVTTSTPERQEGIDLLKKAINRIEETIKGLNGSFNVQMAVRIF
jgi:translation initiation factor 2 alpha subunit (eIF-2alpha)